LGRIPRRSRSILSLTGLNAEVEARIKGVRGLHNIDVYVEGAYHNIEFKWIVECKDNIEFKWIVECKAWKSNVPKEKAMALMSILQDVGADRGFFEVYPIV
jgi:hypothetical protein